jgi:hypothetical protein
MKRSEAILSLSEKLQKSQNLLDGYKNGSIDLKCLCDNLATRAVDYCVYDLKMSPPRDDSYLDFFAKELGYLNWLDYLDHDVDNVIGGWEIEDET